MLGYVVRAAVRAGIPLCLKGSEEEALLVAADSRAFSVVGFVFCALRLRCFHK